MKKTTLPLALPNNTLLLTFSLINFLSFAVPFSLGHPQLLVGSIVNACLFLGALFLPQKFIYSIIFLPSLAVLSRGIIFGPFTPFLIFMVPFIWVGNWLLVFGFKRLFNKSQNYWLAAFTVAFLKYLFLYSSALLLFKLKILPKLFLTSMGFLQLITALLGAVITSIVKNFYDRIGRN